MRESVGSSRHKRAGWCAWRRRTASWLSSLSAGLVIGSTKSLPCGGLLQRSDVASTIRKSMRRSGHGEVPHMYDSMLGRVAERRLGGWLTVRQMRRNAGSSNISSLRSLHKKSCRTPLTPRSQSKILYLIDTRFTLRTLHAQ